MGTDAEAEREAVAQETPVAPDAPQEDAGDDDARMLRRWGLPIGVVAIFAVVVMVMSLVGVGPAILVLAATALLVVIGFLFRAVQAIAEPDEGDDTREELPPTLAEEQKRAALRALKELEFEKSVGNISPEDYAVIVGRYREEAKRAMRAVDDERKAMRERAEKLAKKAIRAEVGEDLADASQNPFPAPEGETASTAVDAADASTPTLCPRCALANDDDARFCKGCGAVIGDVA
ncbi:MAG: zinc ribbon domain-containing protein [Polyangiales bacterium]